MGADGSSTGDAQSHRSVTAMRKVAKLGDGAWLRQRYVIEGASIRHLQRSWGTRLLWYAAPSPPKAYRFEPAVHSAS